MRKASLPGTPKRVMTGVFAGVPGSLMVTGDGLKRGDSIALVGGETGPIAHRGPRLLGAGRLRRGARRLRRATRGRELRAGAAAPST